MFSNEGVWFSQAGFSCRTDSILQVTYTGEIKSVPPSLCGRRENCCCCYLLLLFNMCNLAVGHESSTVSNLSCGLVGH